MSKYYTRYVMTGTKGLQKQTIELNSYKELIKLYSGTYFLSLINIVTFWDRSITGGRISFLCSNYRESLGKKSCVGPVRRALTFNKKKED